MHSYKKLKRYYQTLLLHIKIICTFPHSSLVGWRSFIKKTFKPCDKTLRGVMLKLSPAMHLTQIACAYTFV